jgi:tRNA-specific 2-thiouridylase
MGRDRSKDQSYFLAMLSRGQLARAVFPVGDLSKAEVVRIAAERGLAQAGRRESQDICFVPPGGPGDWIGVRSLDAPGAGDMEDCRGMKIGRHRGVHHYTVGQRKGLGVALGRPVYVVRLDAARNVVVVGDRSEAMARRMTVTGASWIAGAPPSAEFRASVRIRYSHPGAGCRAAVQGDGTVAVLFDEPQFAVAPGQLAVFNDGDEVLGGGWISA